MVTLIFAPGGLVRRLCDSRKDIVFLDDKGWWVFDGSSSTRTLVDVFAVDIEWGGIDLAGIVDAMRASGPTWMRWVGQADSYELLYREGLLYVLHLVAGLRRFGIRHAVFHTSLSHHLDSSFLEIACGQCAIPQVFLYNTGVDGRLLPLVQDRGIEDRRPLNAVVSDHHAGADITTFIGNKLEGKRPVHNQPVKRYYLSPSGAFMVAGYYAIRRVAHRVQRSATGGERSFFERFPELSFGDHVRLIRRQMRALEFYDRHALQPDAVRQLVSRREEEPALLIAAHFQPEAACFPEGGIYNNHIDIVAALRNMGFHGRIIYKEHFATYRYFAPILGTTRVGMYRSVGYYQQLLDLNCILASPAMPLSLDESTNRGYLPVTMTGTIALERSLNGQHTICAGHPWFEHMPGVAPISHTMQLLASGPGVTGRSPEIADAASRFLDTTLSKRTVVNAPGIGTGIPSTDEESLRAFAREFNTMLVELQALELATGAAAP